MVVDQDAAAVVGGHTNLLQAQLLGVADPAGGEDHLLGRDRLAPRRLDLEPAGAAGHAGDPGLRQDAHPERREVPRQDRRQLRVEERQEAGAAVDQGHLGPEGKEDGRVFARHGAAADHHQAPEGTIDRLRTVRVEDIGIVEGDAGGLERPGSGGDDHGTSPEHPRRTTLQRPHRHSVVGSQACHPGHEFDVVAPEVLADRRGHEGGDLGLPGAHPFDEDGGREVEPHPVEAVAREAGEVERRLAHRLAGDGAGDHGPARIGKAVDDRHALAEVGRLGGGLLAGGTRPDHDQVEGVRFLAVPHPYSVPAASALTLQARPRRRSSARA